MIKIVKIKEKIESLIPAFNGFVFNFVFSKEAPKLSELETLEVGELHDRTFQVNIDAAKSLVVKYGAFFLALESLLKVGAYEYVNSVAIAILITLMHMILRVSYTLYCELKHDQIMRTKKLQKAS